MVFSKTEMRFSISVLSIVPGRFSSSVLAEKSEISEAFENEAGQISAVTVGDE